MSVDLTWRLICLGSILFNSYSNAFAPADSIAGQPLLGSSFGVPGINTTFDYVIVGGGNAGLALAYRLSSNPANLVAVIEAGSFYELSNGNLSQIPRYLSRGNGQSFSDVNPLVDWNFRTQPEPGIGAKRIHYPRGKTLGGSSARNNMVYHRATKGSYKKWADQVGDASYKWDSFRAYFDKGTTFHAADASRRPANATPENDPAGAQATSGPVSISYPSFVLSITSWVIKAVDALGLRPIPGFIDGVLIGSSYNLVTVDAKSQVRESSETAYLRPALKRPNLIVYQSTMATKVLFEGKEAVGVACDTLGTNFTLSAAKEVILSAGALQSPQLLMVSGIGPRDALAAQGIPVLVDAPGVGQALEDQPFVAVFHKVNVESSTVLNTPEKNQAAIANFLKDGSGPLASAGGEVFGWEKAPRRLISNSTAAGLSTLPGDWPDYELLTVAAYPGVTPPDTADYAGISVCLASTFSRGNVTINSASMLDPPVVTIGFVSDPRDQDLLIAGVKRAREIWAHPSMRPVVLGPEVSPGNGTATDAQILQYVQNTAATVSHASCTCKMGKKNDPMAVVDPTGKVYGVQRLRVVDASSFPFLPPGHLMATVYALAEKIADDILNGR